MGSPRRIQKDQVNSSIILILALSTLKFRHSDIRKDEEISGTVCKPWLNPEMKNGKE